MKIKSTLKKTKLVTTDVDGVLTDGGIYVDSNGNDFKRFNVLDGEGIKQLKKHGIEVAFISSSNSQCIQHRANSLGVNNVYLGVIDKASVLEKLVNELGISYEETCHIADDVNDISILNKVGIPIAVKNSVNQVKAVSLYITKKAGGNGAFRELVDLILEEINE